MPPSNTQSPQRIAKLLARAGIASRREVERMIAEGRIALDGKLLETPATILTSLDGVTVDGNPVEKPAPARLFRYHKPAGLLTTERDPLERPIIYDHLPEGLPRVMPVGRLDLSTEGLLLLTTDGELKRQLELPATGVERSYRARAYGHVTQEQLEDLMLGVEIEGIRYGPINANIERRTGANLWIEMTLTEGKNREVRRVLEFLGLQVNRLIRTRYGPFWLGDLPVGDVDEIRSNDLATFRTVVSKPGGGKAASNLQFAVRQRVVEAPKPTGVEEPQGRRRIAQPPKPVRAPSPAPVFAPHAPSGGRSDQSRRGPPADRDAPRGGSFGRDSRDDRAPRSGFAPSDQSRRSGQPSRFARDERPAREDTRRPGFAPRDDARRPAPAGKFGARDDRPARDDRAPRSPGFAPRGDDTRRPAPAGRFGAREDRPVRDERAPRSPGFAPRGDDARRPAPAGRFGAREDRPARDDARRPAPAGKFGARDDRAPRPARDDRAPRPGFAPRPGAAPRPGFTPGETRAPRPVRDERPARQGAFTPRMTPQAKGDAPHGAGRPDQRRDAPDNAGRAARAQKFRDTQEPRTGGFSDRPAKPPRTRGPADGRGKPAKPGRPTRTRK